MSSLDRTHRKTLERVVGKARVQAEEGARKALAHLTVEQARTGTHLTTEQQKLRNRLRARARQLGDARDSSARQKIDRLIEQCAYELWHRMLFARFLAENDLLIEPQSGVAISLDECRQLAAAQQRAWIDLASEFAVRMLPQVFRPDDPVLEVQLPAEARNALEELLDELPGAVFTADDSLGWTYQFWQAEQKDRINKSGKKIGAEELGAVTQLFTEDYMVDFLLHNTLGAWWAGKLGPVHAASEDDARTQAALPARDGLPPVEWRYLRFVQGDDGAWRPAAGTFDGWPNHAREITVLDPCMGSGHFLVFALPILAGLRAEEEGLGVGDAVAAVLRDSLFGLELDERCTQIAAFNLALTAWRFAGYCPLPRLNLACSGLNLEASEAEWVALAHGDERLGAGMKRLHQLFRNAPTLGSLINPIAARSDLQIDSFVADFDEAAPLIEEALARAGQDVNDAHELAVTAQGAARAAQILTGRYTLVPTNVPYLGRGKQGPVVKDYAEQYHGHAKADLATCFVERCLSFCASGGTASLVTPQNWLFLDTYKHLRKRLLADIEWDLVARLGARAFETISGEVVNVALLILTRREEEALHTIAGIDASAAESSTGKAQGIRAIDISIALQRAQQGNPDAIISHQAIQSQSRLGQYAQCYQGVSPGDTDRLVRCFWEVSQSPDRWRFFQSPPTTGTFSGKELVVDWLTIADGFESAAIRGREAWGRRGIAIGQMSNLPSSLYEGDLFSNSTPVIIPLQESHLPALWSYVSSSSFATDLRTLNQKVSVDNGYVSKVPFDFEHWDSIARTQYPNGLPTPHSNDPTQWLFAGNPRDCIAPLQVAAARLVGFQWPTGARVDQLTDLADADGILCLPALQREVAATVRLRSVLARAFESEWKTATERELLENGTNTSRSLEDWLRDTFFAQHCDLFHHIPFVLHIWDGLRDGFSALVNYHKLAGPNGEGRRTLEKLTHTYLGDWITRQKAAKASGEDGAETRLAAAEHLKVEFEKILHGEPPYDIFVRWKPLHEQPIGWEPDINDGVRVNIRPFMKARPYKARGRNTCILRLTPKKLKWEKDRGKEPPRSKEDYPWFWDWDQKTVDFMGGGQFDGARWNDLHYTRAAKQRAREAYVARTKGGTR